jgi:hypothetical protein
MARKESPSRRAQISVAPLRSGAPSCVPGAYRPPSWRRAPRACAGRSACARAGRKWRRCSPSPRPSASTGPRGSRARGRLRAWGLPRRGRGADCRGPQRAHGLPPRDWPHGARALQRGRPRGRSLTPSQPQVGGPTRQRQLEPLLLERPPRTGGHQYVTGVGRLDSSAATRASGSAVVVDALSRGVGRSVPEALDDQATRRCARGRGSRGCDITRA